MKYPEDIPVTVPNLLKFILDHSAPRGGATQPACEQSEAGLQRGHISHLERQVARLRAEISALQRAQGQVEARLAGARRDEHRLQRQKRALEEQRGLLRRHGQQLKALYEQKTRELQGLAQRLQELADASESLLAENAWLKVLVATMERKLEARDRAEPGDAHPTGPELPGHENRTD